MSNEDEKKDKESVFKSKHYFDLNDAVQGVKTEFQAGDVGDKAKSSAKLLGKSVFNLGLFVGKVGIEVVKNLPQATARMADSHLKSNTNLTDEQRSKLEDIVERGKK
jgi:hypothetical protein